MNPDFFTGLIVGLAIGTVISSYVMIKEYRQLQEIVKGINEGEGDEP